MVIGSVLIDQAGDIVVIVVPVRIVTITGEMFHRFSLCVDPPERGGIRLYLQNVDCLLPANIAITNAPALADTGIIQSRCKALIIPHILRYQLAR
jgi:hypothetical protein